eukprot:1184822-Prorocentrum_minimum.AAC.1
MAVLYRRQLTGRAFQYDRVWKSSATNWRVAIIFARSSGSRFLSPGSGGGPTPLDRAKIIAIRGNRCDGQAKLRARGIPFNTHGTAPYRRQCVRDLLGVLRAMASAADDTSLRRALKALIELARPDAKRVVAHVDKQA